jgi:SAM-dependent methyltransferase
MTPRFGGDVAEYYAAFRRGYPPGLLDALQAAFDLTAADTVLDLGCGTGQLTLPLAARVGTVVGMDPEPDMLRLARRAATERGVRNATWVLGADTDTPALGLLLGRGALAMAVIGQALHWMEHDRLFRDLAPLLRAGGGVAVVSNGTPLWQQDTAWSQALRACLEDHFGTELTASCGTAAHDRQVHRESLTAAGFDQVREVAVEYRDTVDAEAIVGGVLSAMDTAELPPPDARSAFAERVRRALPAGGAFTEHVRVTALLARPR